MTNLPYQPIVKHNDLLFISGQLPIKDNQLLTDITQATLQCLKNIESLLLKNNSDLQHVLKTTVFMTDFSQFDKMNQAYASIFTLNPPARSAIEVKSLPKGAIVEIECIATTK